MQSPLGPWFWWTDWPLADLQAFCSSAAQLISVGRAWHQTWEASSQDALQSTLNTHSVSFRGMSSKSVTTRWERFIFKWIKPAHLQIYVRINLLIKTQGMNIHEHHVLAFTCALQSACIERWFKDYSLSGVKGGFSLPYTTQPSIKFTQLFRAAFWSVAPKTSLPCSFSRHQTQGWLIAGKVAALTWHQEGFLGQPAQHLMLKQHQKREGTDDSLHPGSPVYTPRYI